VLLVVEGDNAAAIVARVINIPEVGMNSPIAVDRTRRVSCAENIGCDCPT
jgi:hypothetical protein